MRLQHHKRLNFLQNRYYFVFGFLQKCWFRVFFSAFLQTLFWILTNLKCLGLSNFCALFAFLRKAFVHILLESEMRSYLSVSSAFLEAPNEVYREKCQASKICFAGAANSFDEKKGKSVGVFKATKNLQRVFHSPAWVLSSFLVFRSKSKAPGFRWEDRFVFSPVSQKPTALSIEPGLSSVSRHEDLWCTHIWKNTSSPPPMRVSAAVHHKLGRVWYSPCAANNQNLEFTWCNNSKFESKHHGIRGVFKWDWKSSSCFVSYCRFRLQFKRIIFKGGLFELGQNDH